MIFYLLRQGRMRSATGDDGTRFSLSYCDRPASRAYLGDQAPPSVQSFSPPCIALERPGISVGGSLSAGTPL